MVVAGVKGVGWGVCKGKGGVWQRVCGTKGDQTREAKVSESHQVSIRDHLRSENRTLTRIQTTDHQS